MSMSDARMLAELVARVDKLEAQVTELMADRREVDVSQEVLGPVADVEARDGLRKMFKESRKDMPVPKAEPKAEAPDGV